MAGQYAVSSLSAHTSRQPRSTCTTAARWSCPAACSASKQRPLLGGQGFGWDREAPGSSALMAASLALWGVDAERPLRPRRKPPGRGRVIVLD